MSATERGPLLTYQVTWKSGHIETIEAHQVIMPSRLSVFGGEVEKDPRVMFHGEIDGRWQLILAAPESEIHTIRNVTAQEATTDGDL